MERVQFTNQMAQSLVANRKKAGLSQYELALKVQTPRASVKRWECFEVKTIDKDVLKRIETVLGRLSKARAKATKPRTTKRRSHTANLSGVLVASKGNFLRYNVTFASETTMRLFGSGPAKRVSVPIDRLYGPVRLFDNDSRKTISGEVVGVESTTKQTKEGLKPGDSVVVALLADP